MRRMLQVMLAAALILTVGGASAVRERTDDDRREEALRDSDDYNRAVREATCDVAASGALLGYTRSVGGFPVAIDVQDGNAFVGDWNSLPYQGIFQVIDVSDPCAPSIVWWRATTSPGYNEVSDLAVSGNYAFLANDANGLAVFDISNPRSPIFITRRIETTYTKSVTLMRRDDGRSYVIATYTYPWKGEMAIFESTHLPLLGEPAWYNSDVGDHGWDTKVAGDRLYLLATDDQTQALVLEILDISDLPRITLLGRVLLPASIYGNIGEMEVSDGYVYLAMSDHAGIQNGGIRVIDVSDETKPHVVSRVDIPAGHVPWFGVGIAVSGERAYIAAKDFLYVFDISDPLEPEVLATHVYPAAFSPSVGGRVAVRDSLAYVVAFGDVHERVDRGGLAIYDINDAQGPQDMTPPLCRLQQVEPGPPARIQVLAQDTGSGLFAIDVITARNVNVTGHAGFDVGTTEPILVMATKLEEGQRSTLVLKVTDLAGNETTCDPVVSTLTVEVPERFSLEPAYPNPFNPRTAIRYGLAERVHVRLDVIDLAGRRIATLVDGPMGPGTYEAVFEASDLPSGTYAYRLEAGLFSATGTMTLLK